MQPLTLPNLNVRQLELQVALGKANAEIKRLTVKRSGQIEQLVQDYMPALTLLRYQKLSADFPDFLTRTLSTLFIRHRKVLGLFKPAGYDSALLLLQAQFRVYLAGLAQLRELDQMLRQLSIHANGIQAELLTLGTLRQHLQALKPEGAPEPSARSLATRRASAPVAVPKHRHSHDDDDNVILYDAHNLLEWTMPFATPEEQVADRLPVEFPAGNVGASLPQPDQPAVSIATDDRLGYYS